MTVTQRVSTYLGLRGQSEDTDAIPQWQGCPQGTAWRVTSMWIAVGIGAFFLLSARVPSEDGFGGFIPLWLAVLISIAGLNATERAMIRSR